MMFLMLMKLPVMKPRKPTRNRKILRESLSLPISGQNVTVSRMGGAIKARVEELTAPTKDMNRSSFGMAAARPTAHKTRFLKDC